MTDERPVRRSSKVKVAEFLAAVGEGNLFTKLQLFEGVPGVAQADRRMRDLRELGWKIDNYKTDPHLQPDEYRLTRIGTRIDLGEQPKETPRPRISAARRREAIERAGSACQTCGMAAGEPYPDEDLRAVLSVHIIDATPPVDTELSNLRVECQRCNAGIRGGGTALTTPEEVAERASGLSSREEKRRLYRLMQAGRPERDEVDLIFAEWLRLGRDERVEVMLQLAGALIEDE
ncbi:HNH endonuclease [Streptomyces justiciae]|uniref:HNH endonuclease n=1 Tax=Streptomyces justiciae TaxID=2780140 RepID=UPI001881ACDA|nr:HNH endonuclease [Streptomyces justiciae]MBE8469521.1 HNH endonuclease [Streptomyces justiciae]